jgi:uncharacterized protein (TIGR03067 family)
MFRFTLLATVALSPSLLAADGEDLRALQGKWQLMPVRHDGTPNTASKPGSIYWTIEKNRVTYPYNPPEEFTLVPGTEPKAIDFRSVKEDGTVVVRRAIYRLDGNDLVVCHAKGGAERPDGFGSTRGLPRYITRLRKVEE